MHGSIDRLLHVDLCNVSKQGIDIGISYKPAWYDERTRARARIGTFHHRVSSSVVVCTTKMWIYTADVCNGSLFRAESDAVSFGTTRDANHRATTHDDWINCWNRHAD